MRTDAERLALQWGVPVALALFAVLVRLLFAGDRMTVVGIFRSLLVGLFVGASVNLYLGDFETIGPGLRGALVGVSAVLAEDLVLGLLVLGRRVRTDPNAIFNLLFRGGIK